MKWLKRLFGKKESTFVGDFIDSGEDLLKLAASNPVVEAELKEFETRIADSSDGSTPDQEAFKSAEALSGYGISVSKKAFLETTEYH